MVERDGVKANSMGLKFTSQCQSSLRHFHIYLVSPLADPIWSGDSMTNAR